MTPAWAVLYEAMHRINPDWPYRLDDWMSARYYASCGTWRWRFWFEVTGQGRAARRYMRVLRRGRKRWLSEIKAGQP